MVCHCVDGDKEKCEESKHTRKRMNGSCPGEDKLKKEIKQAAAI